MKFLSLSIAALLFSKAALSLSFAQSDSDFVSISDITQALNPLENIANYGGVRMSIDLNIQFEFNSAQLRTGADAQVKALGEAISQGELKHCKIKLIGHTDASGTAKVNLALSQKRANSVKTFIVNNYDVNADNLVAIGKGESSLLSGLPPYDARHRRVEIALDDIKACQDAIQTQKENDENVIAW